jgi:hypothetical protein
MQVLMMARVGIDCVDCVNCDRILSYQVKLMSTFCTTYSAYYGWPNELMH